jgi:uncharacterized membrane protein
VIPVADPSLTPFLNHVLKETEMQPNQSMIHNALAGIVALGLTALAGNALAAKGDTEKCAGIVKAGQNDCGTSKSACAGSSKADRDAEAWIAVPKGTCAKIAGGVVTDKPENVHGGAAAAKKS